MSARATSGEPALLVALDRGRALTLRLVAPSALMRARDARVAAMAMASVLAAFLFAVGAPRWTLALGPLVLGVPHLLADLRYLVLRPGLHRATASVAVTLAGFGLSLLGYGVRGALLAAAGVVLLAPSSAARRTAVLAAIGAAALVAQRMGAFADLVFAHLHNVVALGLWWAWRPGRSAWQLAPLALVALVSALLLGGALDGVLALSFAHGPLDPAGFVAEIAPGVRTELAARWVALFAFGQSVHYAAWLRLIPDDDRPGGGARSWRASWRALREDVPSWLLAATAALSVALLAWAAVDLAGARRGYFQVAFWHAYLELVVLARWAAGARRA